MGFTEIILNDDYLYLGSHVCPGMYTKKQAMTSVADVSCTTAQCVMEFL